MRSRQNYLLTGLFSLGLAGAVVAYQALGHFEDRVFFAILLVPFGLICLMPAIVRLKGGKFDPFEPPVFLGFIYFLTFGLLSLPLLDPSAPTYAFLGGDFHWLNLALLCLTVGLMCLWLGYRSPLPLWVEKVLHLNRQHSVQLSGQRIKFWWIVVLYALGVLPRIYLLASGTYGYLKLQAWDVYESQLPFLYWLTQMTYFSWYALVLAAIESFIRRGVKERAVFYLILIGEAALIFVSGFRNPLVMLFLSIAVVYFYIYRRIPLRWILVGAIVLLMIFPLTATYRRAIQEGYISARENNQIYGQARAIITESVTQEGIMGLFQMGSKMASARLSYIQDIASAIKFQEEYGYYPRRHEILLFPLLAFVPRAIWPDKPRPQLGYWFSTEVLGGTTITANTTTLPGSFYLFFGFWGYLLAMFLMGALQAFIYRRYAMKRSLSALFFAPFLFVAMVNPEYEVMSFIGLIQQVIVLAVIRKIVFVKPRPFAIEENCGKAFIVRTK